MTEDKKHILTAEETVSISAKLMQDMRKYYPARNINMTSLLSDIEITYNIEITELNKILRPLKLNGYLEYEGENYKSIGDGGSILGVPKSYHLWNLNEIQIHGHITEKGYNYLLNIDNVSLSKKLTDETIKSYKNQLRILILTLFVSVVSLLSAILKSDKVNTFLLPQSKYPLKEQQEATTLGRIELKCQHGHDSTCCKDSLYIYYKP